MGNFSTRFHNQVTDVMLAGTHGFETSKFEYVIDRAAKRMAVMTLVLADGYTFDWDVKGGSLIAKPLTGGGIEDAWERATALSKRRLLPSEVWDLQADLNESLRACHATMYAARWEEKDKLKSVMPISSMETMMELVSDAGRRVAEDFLVGVQPKLSDMCKDDDNLSVDSKELRELLLLLVPHVDREIKDVGVKCFANLVIEELYAASPSMGTAERIMASVKAMTVDDTGHNVTLGVRPVTKRSSPNPDHSVESMRKLVEKGMRGPYDRRAASYVNMRKSAKMIAKSIVAAVAPLVGEAGARVDPGTVPAMTNMELPPP